MTAPEPHPFEASPASRPPRATGRQAAVTAIVGAAAFVVGTVVAGLVTYHGEALVNIAAGVFSLPLLVWLALVGALALALPRARSGAFAVWAVVAAPVATLIANAPSAAYGGPLLLVLAWQAAGLAGAALVGAIAGVIDRNRVAQDAGPRVARDDTAGDAHETAADDAAVERPAAPGRRRMLTGATLALLVVGSALAFALPTQWLDVYFAIWDAPPPPTPEDGIRYLWTGGLALAFLLAALVVAVVRRGRGLIVLTAVALGCAVIGALLFQVPQGRFVPRPAPVEDVRDHPVCFGTTGDCPGG